MKLDAVSVASTNLEKTARFYSLLGFIFPTVGPQARHLESISSAGEVRLVIDDSAMVKSIMGKDPAPPAHSSFAMHKPEAARRGCRGDSQSRIRRRYRTVGRVLGTKIRNRRRSRRLYERSVRGALTSSHAPHQWASNRLKDWRCSPSPLVGEGTRRPLHRVG
jgi:hypothetical protein